ncbi:MAG TPA: formate dehydrogenase accessory protein FdhE [Gallionella sp.]|nr:formate dehydrogenase accessory protein FdhE [Gallionella sp.]
MTTTSIIQPGEIGRPIGDIPFIRIPERNAVFRDRAMRLRTLAQDHAMKDFLSFMANVCDAQQAVLNAFPEVLLPAEAQLMLCREHGMPPFSVQSWQRDPSWQDALRRIAAQLQESATPASKETLARLQQMDGASLEVFADAVLSGRYQGMDLAAAPFVAAALQVYWTHMVTTLGVRAFGRSDISNLCPVCASPPVASIVRTGGAENGGRYLSCSLCETQWHMVRVKCSNCESTKGIGYYSIEGASGSVKAESCDECGTYLKIAYMDKEPQVDPVADDLATLVLDLMMDGTGKSRSGPNLFLMTA